VRIGLRREDKHPFEARVPLIPVDVRRLVDAEGLDVVVEESSQRAIPDTDFAAAGARIAPDLTDCPVIFGVKEIPVDRIEPGKTYVVFAHVIKGQRHNMPLLQRLMDGGCQLIDYERITDADGRRLVFFGRHAGLAGMIDTLWAYGRRMERRAIETPFRHVHQAKDYPSVAGAKTAIAQVGEAIRSHGLPPGVPPLICGIAGYGNVSRGAQEIIDLLPIETILPEDIASVGTRDDGGTKRIYKVVFHEKHLVTPKNPGAAFDLDEYYRHPERYQSQFAHYLPHLGMLVNCIYWDSRYPRLVTRAAVQALYREDPSPRLQVIGDITCDVRGSIECNLRATEPDNPVYVYDVDRDAAIDGVEGNGPVIMAVDFLPAELPMDASQDFSRVLSPFVPAIARADYTVPFAACQLPPEIRRATVVYQGKLTEDYEYLASSLP
jgi:alpha-aminoadipic semialdehyde synthase